MAQFIVILKEGSEFVYDDDIERTYDRYFIKYKNRTSSTTWGFGNLNIIYRLRLAILREELSPLSITIVYNGKNYRIGGDGNITPPLPFPDKLSERQKILEEIDALQSELRYEEQDE